MNVIRNSLVDSREISETEFSDLKNLWTRDYADSFSGSGLMDHETATNRAMELWTKTFDEGAKTNGHLIKTLIDYESKKAVGFIWVSQFYPTQKNCFLSYLHVFLEFRRKGYGKAAMKTMGDYLRKKGIKEMRLNVFADNPAARALYSSIGFSEALITLRKEL